MHIGYQIYFDEEERKVTWAAQMVMIRVLKLEIVFRSHSRLDEDTLRFLQQKLGRALQVLEQRLEQALNTPVQQDTTEAGTLADWRRKVLLGQQVFDRALALVERVRDDHARRLGPATLVAREGVATL